MYLIASVVKVEHDEPLAKVSLKLSDLIQSVFSTKIRRKSLSTCIKIQHNARAAMYFLVCRRSSPRNAANFHYIA